MQISISLIDLIVHLRNSSRNGFDRFENARMSQVWTELDESDKSVEVVWKIVSNNKSL